MLDPRLVSEWMRNHIGGNFKLAGVADDNEVFVEFNAISYLDTAKSREQEDLVRESLRQKFPEITKVTFVIKPSISQLEDLLQNLNATLETKKPQKQLLDIGEF